jgi:cardiolipin synthase (CMP-forming)
MIPLFLYLLFLKTRLTMILSLVVFCIASLTDILDGWSARRFNQETSFGRFLDPLADKFLVISTFIALLYLDPLIQFWMIAVIVGRDLLITLMRYLAVKKGVEVKTSRFGKIKTAFQMISIIIILMVFIVRFSMKKYPGYSMSKLLKKFQNEGYDMIEVYKIFASGHPDRFIIIAPYCLMMIVTILTAFSGLRYIITNRHLFLPPYFIKNKD